MIERAKYFAIGCHGLQKRKYTNEPYWLHPESVVNILKKYYPIEEALVVGWLHDVVEDTWVTCFDIQVHFNEKIAFYVSQLTMPDRGYGNREKRIIHYNEVLSNSCEIVQTVKYADLIHNTASIEKYDPHFAKTYLKEKRDLLMKMDKGYPALYEIACKQCHM